MDHLYTWKAALLLAAREKVACQVGKSYLAWMASILDHLGLQTGARNGRRYIQRNILVYRCPLTSNTTLPSCLLRSSLSTSCVSSTSPHIPVCQLTSILATCAASSIPNFSSLF